MKIKIFVVLFFIVFFKINAQTQSVNVLDSIAQKKYDGIYKELYDCMLKFYRSESRLNLTSQIEVWNASIRYRQNKDEFEKVPANEKISWLKKNIDKTFFKDTADVDAKWNKLLELQIAASNENPEYYKWRRALLTSVDGAKFYFKIDRDIQEEHSELFKGGASDVISGMFH